MGTRSNIALKNDNGSVTVIYCHWDGNPSHVGDILQTHYNTETQLLALLAIGDLSELRAEVGSQQSFDAPWCVAYGRDRGESNVSATTYHSVDTWISEGGEEYNYLMINGVWYVNDHGQRDSDGFAVFTDLATVLLLESATQ